MARRDSNDAFLNTAFLYGANAGYIEDLYARYQEDPAAVDAEWQAFFGALKDDKLSVVQNARGASWKKPGWPVPANGELVSALDGNWAQIGRAVGERIQAKAQAKGVEISDADVQQATRDSVRALMLIRSYRVRGHLHADLDPLGINPRPSDGELHPSHYGFSEADWDRRIFLDNVLGLEFATIREIVAILRAHLLPDARRRVHAHLGPDREGLDPGADRGARQGDLVHSGGEARDPQQAHRGRRIREIPRPQVHGYEALRPRRR